MSSVQGANGAASAIQQWQYLQSLLSTGSAGSKKAGGSDQAATAFDPFAGLGGGEASSATGGPRPPISLGTMSALIDAQAQASTGTGLSQFQQKMFGKLDGDSDGSVTKAELEKAFGTDNQAASDYVMKKLDTDSDGAISQSEFAAGTTKSAQHRHAVPPPDQTDQSANAKDPLSQLLQAVGASSTSTSNSDGSSTTTITYADGSKISMTTAASSNADNSTNSGTSNRAQSNLLETLIKLQAQLTNSTTATSSTTA